MINILLRMDIYDKKQYMKKNINKLPHADKKLVGNVLLSNNLASYLKPCAQGTVINLDALSDEIVIQMYDLIYKRLNTNSADAINKLFANS